jgi:hypothetical protein
MIALLVALSLAAPLPSGADAAYRRVVAAALARQQAALVGGIDFEVDHSRWEDPWIVTSAHYEVRSTHSFGQASELAKNLEFMRGQFTALLGEGRKAAGPARIWVVPSIVEYNRFGNDFGAEHSSMLGCFFASDHPEQPVIAYYDGNWTRLGMWITHGALHQYVAHEFVRALPAWIDEGLASYFALMWDWKYGAAQLGELEKRNRLSSLARLVAEPLQTYVGRGEERFVQLGMLYRFLLEECEATKDEVSSGERRGPFRDFLRASVRGERAASVEFEELLATDAELLEEDFRAFDFSTW